MNNKADLIFKIIISVAIIVTLAFIVIPDKGSASGAPAGYSGSAGAGGQRPAGVGQTGQNTGGQVDATSSSAEGQSAAAGQKPAGAPANGQRPAGMTGGASGMAGSNSLAVSAFKARIDTVSNYLKVNGDIITEAEIDIYPDATGILVDLDVSLGDYVVRDQIVASVDPSLPGQKYALSAVYTSVNGTVLSLKVHEGDKVSSNSPVMTIGDLSDLKLVTYIPEKYVGNLKTGLPAEITFAAFEGEVFTGRITEIGTVLDSTSRTLEVTLNLDDGQSKVKAGMFASIKLVTEQVHDVVVIPGEALFTYYGKNTVYVIENGTVSRREVTLGLESSDSVEIVSGLSADETVVTQGQSLLSEGSAVHIVE